MSQFPSNRSSGFIFRLELDHPLLGSPHSFHHHLGLLQSPESIYSKCESTEHSHQCHGLQICTDHICLPNHLHHLLYSGTYHQNHGGHHYLVFSIHVLLTGKRRSGLLHHMDALRNQLLYGSHPVLLCLRQV